METLENRESAYQTYIQNLNTLRAKKASEDSIRDVFLVLLRSLFPKLEQSDPILLESYMPALRVKSGFADVLYGDLIFEFKRRLDNASRNEGKKELEKYILNQKFPQRWYGILTDGEKLEVYVVRHDRLVNEPVDEILIRQDNFKEVFFWLDIYFFHEKNIIPTADDVVSRFGETSPVFQRAMERLQNMWQAVKNKPSVKVKYSEWNTLLSFVYGSAVGDEALFLRHTYLAHFARILAYLVVKRRPPQSKKINDVLTGEAFQKMGYVNLVEEDFFAWILSDGIQTEAEELFYAVMGRLSCYDLDYVYEDLLKELYQGLVDPVTRHDLGEYYTPDWLAEFSLRCAGFPPEDVLADNSPLLLDPSCGSGTFLFKAVHLLKEAGIKGATLVNLVVNRLAGVDIHPLAVVIARVNLILALSEDLKYYGKQVSLPVYLANALIEEISEQITNVNVPVDEIAKNRGLKKPKEMSGSFSLPIETVLEPSHLDTILDLVLKFARINAEEKVIKEGFSAKLKELNQDRWTWLWLSNLELYRWLLKNDYDTVWRFILRNAYRPLFFAKNKCRFIVGNPPWLSYRFIQAKKYQEEIRQLVFGYNLLTKRQRHLFTHMELATVFFAFCFDKFLRDEGIIAFILPRSSIKGAKQHAAFRANYLRDAICIIDCESVGPLFNVPAYVVICKKPSAPSVAVYRKDEVSKKVNAVVLNGILPGKNFPLREAWKYLKQELTTIDLTVDKNVSPYFDCIDKGVTIVPRCFWFVRPTEEAHIVDREFPHLESDPELEQDAKPPWKGLRVDGAVESEFLFATLLSKHMLPFGWLKLSLIVLPLIEHEGRWLLQSYENAVQQGKIGLADWLQKVENLWERHKKRLSHYNLLEWLNWQNKLMIQRPVGCYKVLYNETGTHLCSCVLNASLNEYDNLPGLYGFSVYKFIADTKTYWYETEDVNEAHYLCAVLNAPYTDEAIKPYQTKGIFGTYSGGGERDIHRRPFEVLPIPVFDPGNEKHLGLAILSKACHAKVSGILDKTDFRERKYPIGILRRDIRKLIADELMEIDKLVKEILKR